MAVILSIGIGCQRPLRSRLRLSILRIIEVGGKEWWLISKRGDGCMSSEGNLLTS